MVCRLAELAAVNVRFEETVDKIEAS